MGVLGLSGRSMEGEKDTPRTRTRKRQKATEMTKKMESFSTKLDVIEEEFDDPSIAEWQEIRKLAREISLHYSLVAKSTRSRQGRRVSKSPSGSGSDSSPLRAPVGE